ncbi:chemotaxis protein CheW [Candidatus Endobugula sertula]|uniref:Chemotaxis protein CheW n=1 Tax=Candidatus Endobugula sertula TaxID=62101 RepID=A0A1D2QSM8_9GAMM|nr:chemotaxis protein CheW [Candidatus Endobugula sertula]
MVEQTSAYRTLQALAAKSRFFAHQLPSETNIVSQWSGIGFSLLGLHFVAPMEELVEMLEIPAYTKLPGVHPWVKGVSNIRGRLLPLFDLAAFFLAELTGNKKHQRLLVLDNQQVYASIWVDSVFGIQYFPTDSKHPDVPDHVPARMRGFVDGYYEANECQWIVFHLASLSQDAQFLRVAAS